MSSPTEIRLPDIGDFTGVPVIEVHVAPGDEVAVDDPIVTLESDKATMDIPAPQAGTVRELRVGVGDEVSEGDVLLLLDAAGAGDGPAETVDSREQAPSESATPPLRGAEPGAGSVQAAPAPTPASAAGIQADVQAEVLVLGAGPGGYSAAFRAADLGSSVVLVDRSPILGGVCLNVGCIPSKALLHAARVIAETREMAEHGLAFGEPAVDLDKLRAWKESVVKRLTGGLASLAKARKVKVVTGLGVFASPNHLEVTADDGSRTVVGFEQAIIACGSEPVTLPFIPHDDPRVVDSTGALELEGVPERLLVVGGGIIGLEMATVYHELGSKVTIVELLDQLIPGADKDLVAPLSKRISKRYEAAYLTTKVTRVDAEADGLRVHFEGAKAPETDRFDRVLVSVGRRPNGAAIGAERAGVAVDERGFIGVDKQQRTNVPHIFAIGDVVGQPMLAHKAVHEGHVAAEVTAGMPSYFDVRGIPSVAY
ncbi:MAG TPA: FAD-dependent oxidoreductase, partial [Actinomycetes bacterium]|nr:FAD-dependent oxidoreductase [Actinomycetes bacterium]